MELERSVRCRPRQRFVEVAAVVGSAAVAVSPAAAVVANDFDVNCAKQSLDHYSTAM